MTITFESKAVEIAVLHASKAPWTQCVGVLLGNSKDGNVTVSKAIPLFHTVVMTPMLEIATKMIQELKGKDEVVGLYICPDRDNYSGIPPIGKKAATTLNSFFDKGSSFVLAVMKASDLANEAAFPFQIWKAPKWLEQENKINVSPSVESVNKTLTTLLKNKSYSEINDFDDFLDDPSVDFTNQALM